MALDSIIQNLIRTALQLRQVEQSLRANPTIATTGQSNASFEQLLTQAQQLSASTESLLSATSGVNGMQPAFPQLPMMGATTAHPQMNQWRSLTPSGAGYGYPTPSATSPAPTLTNPPTNNGLFPTSGLSPYAPAQGNFPVVSTPTPTIPSFQPSSPIPLIPSTAQGAIVPPSQTSAPLSTPSVTGVAPTSGTTSPNPTSTSPLGDIAPIVASQPGRTILSQPLSLDDYPRPVNDNGWGIHWIPTVSQTPEEVDRYVVEAKEMGMKWVVFLNEGANIGANDYLVRRLTEAGIEPIMRVYTPGLTPIEGDVQGMVRHYKAMGVDYFQLYNEPNLKVETGGAPPDPNHYLDLWIPAAEQVVAAGGMPGFGALSPSGEMDDRQFLQQALQGLQQRGKSDILNSGWLSMHNYAGQRTLDDPDGFLRFRQYDQIINSVLGRSIPIIGTEGGAYMSDHNITQSQQIATVTGSYNYMQQQHEPYLFAYSHWAIANGHDPAWEQHALFHPNGPTALAEALMNMNQAQRGIS